jgi:hypothetical protein
MRRLPIVLLPLALAACGSQPEVKAENASIAEVAQAARVASKIEPGQWRTETTIEAVEMPGMPVQIADAMKKQMAANGTQKIETCVTKEQAERPPEELLGGKGSDACRYETFEMKGGKLNAVMTCKGMGPGAGEMRMTIAGDYGGTRYDLIGTAEMGMGQKMTMRTHVKGSRIGACG